MENFPYLTGVSQQRNCPNVQGFNEISETIHPIEQETIFIMWNNRYALTNLICCREKIIFRITVIKIVCYFK